jgi:5-(carboxyamino)imidazole ribonucleotide mutase
MPAGVPVGTLAIGRAGAINAALFAAAILGLSDKKIAANLARWRERQTANAPLTPSDDAPPKR